jgi:hypothetical protein
VAVSGVRVRAAPRLAGSEQPLAAVISTAIGGGAADLVAVIAMIATTNTTLLCLTAASRLQFGMARQGALPPALGRLSSRSVPFVAVGTAVVGAGVAIAVGNLTLVASVTDVAVYLVFVAVNVVVIVLRYRQPHRLRPFRVPLTVGRVPVPSVAALLVVSILIPGLDPAALGLGVVMVAAGLGVHAFLVRRAPRARQVTPIGEDGGVHRTKVTLDEAESVMAALNVDPATVAWDVEQFRMGMESELAHGRADPDTNVTDDDLVLTGKIALAHLVEIPDYYTRLAAMERSAFEEQARPDGRDRTRPDGS